MSARTKRLSPERLWREITRLGDAEFTVRDLHAHFGGTPVDGLRHALLGFERRRFLALVGTRACGNLKPVKVYRCLYPNVRRLPAPPISATRQGKRQLYLWRAMRQIDGWTIVEIAAAASTEEARVSPSCASAYVSSLVKAGIVQVLKPRGSAIGDGSVAATYRVSPAGNSGPLAPEIRRGRRVYDGNSGRWLGDASDSEASA